MGVLQTLYSGDYHVTVISSETFTTFTPLLPCMLPHLVRVHMSYLLIHVLSKAAAVGTVQIRSLIEPIRKIIARLRGHFVQGKAVDLCMSERLIEVETASPINGDKMNIYIPYVVLEMPYPYSRLLTLILVMTN